MRISLQDFRAFAATPMIDIRPLTFLVGENSSGKTSFLSALNFIWRFQERVPNPSFSQPPFDLGTFDEIVHRVRGRKRPDCFSISIDNPITFDPQNYRYRSRTKSDRRSALATMTLMFSNNAGEATVSKLSLNVENISLSLTIAPEPNLNISRSGKILFDSQNEQSELDLGSYALTPRFDYSYLSFMISRLGRQSKSVVEGMGELSEAFSIGYAALEALSESFPRSILASAPVRSSPSRVYTPADQSRSPEGRHTPQILFKIKETNKARWDRLKAGLDEFGRQSGMFSKIDVSKYRSSGSSPFQISVTLNGKQSNLMDVGYGISQTLPILADLIEAPTRSGFLFQQPEVHLHPQAQAALGSYFANHIANHRGSYIIAETHSDYMIDRVRYEIKSGTLSTNEVTILYFEGQGTDINIHEISIDKNGNILNAPPNYRDFFLYEQMRMLGIEGDDVHNN